MCTVTYIQLTLHSDTASYCGQFSHKSFSLSSFQMFPILGSTPSVKDWSAVSLKSELGTGPIYRELAAQLETFQDELSTVAETGQKRTDSRSCVAVDGPVTINHAPWPLGQMVSVYFELRHSALCHTCHTKKLL